MATNRKENPTLASHVAEASGGERDIESSLAAHLLLITRAKHHARLERHLESSKARVDRLDKRLKDLGGSVRSVPKPSKPAKQVKGAAKAAERRATKVATGTAAKVRDAGELRRVLEAARQEQQDALKQSSAYTSLRALAKASGDKDTARLAKSLRAEHRDWASFLSDELKSLSKRLVKAESEERDKAASAKRSTAAKRASRSRKTAGSSNGRKKSTGTRKTAASGRSRGASSSARKSSSSARKSSSSARKSASTTRKSSSGASRKTAASRSGSSGSRSGSTSSRSRGSSKSS